MQKKKINWWAIMAVVVIGVPVGFVGTAIVKKKTDQNKVTIADSLKPIPKDTVQLDNNTITDTEIVDIPKEELAQQYKDEETSKYQEVKDTEKKDAKELDEETLRRREETARLKKERDEQLRQQKEEQAQLRRDELARKEAEKAEQRRLEKERQDQLKAEKAEKDRLKKEEEDRKKAEQAQKLNELKSDAQSIVASGRTDRRIPDNCKMVGNGIDTSYKQFRTNVLEKKYESVTVESVTPDKNGNASQIKVTVVRPKPKPDPKPEPPKPDPKPILSKDDVQKIVSVGKASSIVPEGCVVVINNGNSTNYQNFRNGVKLGSYTNVKVTKVESNANGTAATKVYVTAKVKSADD